MLLRGVAFSWLILGASIGGIQTNSGEMVKGVRRCSTLPEYMLLTHAEGLVPFFECGWSRMFFKLLLSARRLDTSDSHRLCTPSFAG